MTTTERLALRTLCESADFIHVDGQTFLLAPISPPIIDVLAAFEADLEDLEDDNEDRCAGYDDDLEVRIGDMDAGDPVDAEKDGSPCDI